MKKVLIILLSIFLFLSCGSSSDKSKADSKKSSLRLYEGKDFSIKIPKAWNLLTDNKEIVPNPITGNLELAISSSSIKDGFANSLVILSQDLDNKITSKEFSIINNVGAQNDYINYIKTKASDFSFIDGEKSMIFVFKAKYTLQSPFLQYIQTAHICNGDKAFLITLGIPLNIKDTTKYEKLISTFKCG